MRKFAIIFAAIFLVSLIPSVNAEQYQDVELRLNSDLQYPNDRPINVLVQAMAFEDDKPSRTPVLIHAEIRWLNGTAVQTQEVSVAPGVQTIILFEKMEEVGRYYVYARATIQDSIHTDDDMQSIRITYAPQQYTAGFLDAGSFIVTPLYNDNEGQLTITETMETGMGTVKGSTYIVTNQSLEIDVPEGYVAVRYNIIDENGWYNYERSDHTGLTIHGTPYVWIYGDLSRVEPVATFVSIGNVIIGILGGLMILTGCSRFYFSWADQRKVRQKELGIDGSPSFRERRRQQRMRREIEEDMMRRDMSYPYRGRRYY